MANPVLTCRVDWYRNNPAVFTPAICTVRPLDANPLQIVRGRNGDNSGDAKGSLTFTLDNSDDAYTPDRNLLDNPSFEVDTAGWSVAALASLTAAATSITQVTDVATGTGSKAAEVVCPATLNAGAYYALPSTLLFRSGVTYQLRVWLKSMSGSTSVQLGIASSGTPADIATGGGTITGSWAAYTLSWTPSANRSDAVVFVRVSAAAAATFRLDAIQLNAGSALNTYLEAPTKGQLVTGAPVHVYATYSAVDYPLFFGYIERLTPDPLNKTVTLLAYDVLGKMDQVDAVVAANTFIERSPRDFRVEALSEYERGALNLIQNPSFETNTTGWTTALGFGGTLTRITTDHAPAAGGTACAQFVSPAAPNVPAVLGINARLTPVFFSGQVYRFSAYVKAASGTVSCNIGIVTDATGMPASPTVAPLAFTATTTWQRFTFTFTLAAEISGSASAGNAQVPYCYVMVNDASATVLVDGAMLTRGKALYAYADVGAGRWPNWCGNGGFDGGARNGWDDAFSNLCTNPSFETNTTGWSTAGDAFVTAGSSISRVNTQAKFGSWSGGFGAGAAGNGIFMVLSGTYKAGTTYDISMWVFDSATTGNIVDIGIGSNGTPADKAQSNVTITQNAWNQAKVAWTPSVDRTDVHLYLILKTGVSGGTLFVDGIFVTRRDSGVLAAIGSYSDTGPGGGGTFAASRTIGSAQAKYGGLSLAITTQAVAGSGQLHDFNLLAPLFVSGHQYVVSVWLYAADAMPYKVGIGANKGDGTWDEASTTGTLTAAAWNQITLTWTPGADRSAANPFDMVLYVYQTDATARTFYVDGVRVIPGASADAFEMTQWSLANGDEITDVWATSATASGSALAILNTVNLGTLSRHWVTPQLTSPWYLYKTQDRSARPALAETYDNDAEDVKGMEQDAGASATIVGVLWASGTLYASDEAGVGVFGAILASKTYGIAYLSAIATAQDIGAQYLARYAHGHLRPQLYIRNRWPSQLQRDLNDVVAVKVAGWLIPYLVATIERMTLTISSGGSDWQTVYQLDEWPY